MKPFLFDFKPGKLHSMETRQSWIPPIKAGILCFLLFLTQSCTTQRIAGNTFVQETKGYSFSLPGANWEIDKDAWVYEREFGDVVVKKHRSRYIQRTRQRNTDPENDLEIRPRPPKTYEKLILDMDIGFQHKTRAMKILVGTISEGDLIRFLKGKFIRTDSDLPENLIVGYMERIQFFHPPQQPALITAKSLPRAGTANRLEWDDGRNIRVLYGIALTREYLFVLLKADKETPGSDFKEGVQALDQLVENSARLKKN